MIKKLVYKDKAGNKVFLDDDKIAVRNRGNRLVDVQGARLMLKKKKVRDALKKQFSSKFRVKKYLKPKKRR